MPSGAGVRIVLSQVSFTVPRGAVHAVAGPNGSGKTTLLAAVLGQAPFTGRIVARWTRSGRIGYVPQFFHVDPTLPVSVCDFLALTRQRRPVCLGVAPQVRRRISLLLERVGLKGFERRQVSHLSGGELRRLLLANALDPLPELLLLDEPSAGLDEAGTAWLVDLLSSLRHDVTIVLVTHDRDHIDRIADGATMLDGRPR